MNTTSALAVVWPVAIYEPTHWRSTPNTLQLVEQVPAVVALLPYCHPQAVVHVVIVGLVPLYTSPWSGRLPLVVLPRLHQYSEFSESVFRQSSPLLWSGDWISVQVTPWS